MYYSSWSSLFLVKTLVAVMKLCFSVSMTLDFQKTRVRTLCCIKVLIKATKICVPILQVKMSMTGNGSCANEDDVVDGSEGSDGLMGEVHEARGLPRN